MSYYYICYAQPGRGRGRGSGRACTSPPCSVTGPRGLEAPIDGGTLFLLGSGLLYAVNRLRRKEEEFFYCCINLATYFPITSNSKFTVSLICMSLKVVFFIVYGIIATLKEFL